MEQCPVCTLFLREGMSLSDHLDTHPKDQVIRALCCLARGPAPAPASAPASPASTPSPAACSPRSPRHRAPRPARRPRQYQLDTPLFPPQPPQAHPLLRPPHRRSMYVISSSPIASPSPTPSPNPSLSVRMSLPLPPPPSSVGCVGAQPLRLVMPSPSPGLTMYRPYTSVSPCSYAAPSESSSSSESRPAGLKILSNVKIELPMVDRPEIIDLTRNGRCRMIPAFLSGRSVDGDEDGEEAILPDIVDRGFMESRPQPENCFSVIKNAGNARPERRERTPPRSATPEDLDPKRSESPCEEAPPFATAYVKAAPREDSPVKDERSVDGDGQMKEEAKVEADEPVGDAVRPVNVIAFGSVAASSTCSSSGFPESSTRYGESETSAAEMIRDSCGDADYAEFFSAKDSFETADANDGTICKAEKPSKQKKETETRSGYPWVDGLPKEEFTFPSFAYQYPRITECATGDVPENGDDKYADNKYAELICPSEKTEPFLDGEARDAIEKRKDLQSPIDTLNICTDERMPPRGELSEQESSGDVDAAWAGMYCDVGGSSSYNLLARETWHSEGSDVDAPSSPLGEANENEDVPIVTGIKPPDKNYKCATCGMSFNCPKERRVHRAKMHPLNMSTGSLSVSEKTIVKLRKTPVNVIKSPLTVLKTIKIKNEKSTDSLDAVPPEIPEIENNIPLIMQANMSTCVTPGDISTCVKEDLDSLESKPLLNIIKEEPKKRKREYSCITCKEEFASDQLYQEHLKIHPLECLTCGKFFTRRANLQLHIKRHLGIKNFKCEICEKRFITRQKMLEHYNSHTGITPIKCSLCDETFRRHSNMVQHRNRHHLNMKKRLRDYVCHCGEVFHSKKKLAWHKEIHEDRPKACLHCSEKFIHVASLTRHMRRAHNNLYVPDEKRKCENIQCPICSNVYLKSSIDMHMQTHSGKKPYSCIICNKSFTTKWNLKLHRWTHANRSSKPFKCALCKGAFIRSSDYISHMNAHKSVKPYTCNYCGCQFIRKYNCQRHVKEHENDKKYVCQVPDCGKSFHRSYYLSEHMRVHSGARPFSCNICGKTSSTKSNHNKHVKIHHAREPVTTEG